MASRGEASNPFWWVVLGFICGAVATLGVLILHGGGGEERDEPSSEPEASAPFEPAPPAAPPEAPAAVAPANVEPEPAPGPAPTVDPQIADDAAATGMTARAARN